MLGAIGSRFLSLRLCCSCNKGSFPQWLSVLGLATSFNRQLVSLQLQSLFGVVIVKRCGAMKMPRCQKVCKDRNEFFEESIILQRLNQKARE